MLAITNDVGTLTSQQRYLPFGQVRTDLGIIAQTDYGYTGQRDLGMGLMDYKARFYSPALGRFIQPDTLIPDPANPHAWNRFSYVGNNPVRFNDPSGHMRVEDMGDKRGCSDPVYCRGGRPKPLEDLKPKPPRKEDSWWEENRGKIADGLYSLGSISQDLATFGDALFVVGTAGAVTAGCLVGGAAGCLAAAIDMEVGYLSGPKQLLDGLSAASFLFTAIGDTIDDGRLGEATATSFTTVMVGLPSLDPFSSLALNAYGSGYNHGYFNGVISIANGAPLLKE